MDKVIFSQVQSIGQITFRPWQPEDAVLIHHWVTQPYAQFWGMQNDTLQEVAAFYEAMVSREPLSVLIGCIAKTPSFLIETYQACDEDIAQHYDARVGDYGMHILLKPVEQPITGFSRQVFYSVMEYMFSQAAVKRVVVEPDIRNQKIHRLNKCAGFRYDKQINLGHKMAWLAFCTREDFTRAKKTMLMTNNQRPVPSVDSALWQLCNQSLIQKAITEFSHEQLLTPQPLGDSRWRLVVPNTEIEYRFQGKWRVLKHLSIELHSLEKYQAGVKQPLDAARFIIEFTPLLGIPETMLATYLEEISSTLCSSMYKRQKGNPSSDALAKADFQVIEASMTDGHPCFIANNGRIGFDAQDYLKYAPEVGAMIHLYWVAVHRSNAHYAAIPGLSEEQLFREELGETQISQWQEELRRRQLAPEEYLFMPVHPWQWQNKITTVFAADIALQKIIWLGISDDAYQAQQSIRTFFNHSQPQRRYVKTALSILNMGFMRGLSPYYMATTPAVNQWLDNLVANDPWLAHCQFTILKEVATIGYHNRLYEEALVKDSAYKKMFAALWRDNPCTQLKSGQRLMTMAALLHRDDQNKPLLPALIRHSGLTSTDWIDRYLLAYLSPILHCFYRYDLVFMPHGENLILVLDHDAPDHCFMKDIGEEIAVLDTDRELPEAVQRIAAEVPEEIKLLSIFVDVFSCFFRFVSAILDEEGLMSEHLFWSRVANCIHSYQRQHPELKDKFMRFDLFAESYPHSCLNRLQLANNQQMVNLDDPASALKLAGVLENPLAPFRQQQ